MVHRILEFVQIGWEGRRARFLWKADASRFDYLIDFQSALPELRTVPAGFFHETKLAYEADGSLGPGPNAAFVSDDRSDLDG
jgi:hypothetical protein